jgi:predicted transcriptional regulator
MAVVTRSHGALLVAPVGNTCKALRQFSGTQEEITITEPEAEVIRGDNEMEVDDMQEFHCKRITEINKLNGHCILDVEGFDHLVIGKISDPALEKPNNVYTRALNDQTPIVISAKPVKKNGAIYKLFISNANKP